MYATARIVSSLSPYEFPHPLQGTSLYPQGTPTASSNQSLTACSSLVSLLTRIELNTHVMVTEIGDWIN